MRYRPPVVKQVDRPTAAAAAATPYIPPHRRVWRRRYNPQRQASKKVYQFVRYLNSLLGDYTDLVPVLIYCCIMFFYGELCWIILSLPFITITGWFMALILLTVSAVYVNPIVQGIAFQLKKKLF